jgi:hypothetical protein
LQIPKGGVIIPVHKATVMTIPKYTGSMPMLTMMGISVGVSRMTAAAVSMNKPIPTKNIARINTQTSWFMFATGERIWPTI